MIEKVKFAFRCTVSLLFLLFVGLPVALFGQAKKPNILVIFGDDIGYWNVSAYNQGMMH
jgi:arylsulfatase